MMLMRMMKKIVMMMKVMMACRESVTAQTLVAYGNCCLDAEPLELPARSRSSWLTTGTWHPNYRMLTDCCTEFNTGGLQKLQRSRGMHFDRRTLLSRVTEAVHGSLVAMYC